MDKAFKPIYGVPLAKIISRHSPNGHKDKSEDDSHINQNLNHNKKTNH